MRDPDFYPLDTIHLPDQCLDEQGKQKLKRILVMWLMSQEKVCPACIASVLQEIAHDSNELWAMINGFEGGSCQRH